MKIEDKDLLESLRPKQANRIIDLVEQAGIDVTKWGVKKDGSKVEKPETNPNYCSDWAFGGDEEPTLLCIWHKSLKANNGQISFEDNLIERAVDIQRNAENKSRSEKSKASRQASRATKFNSLVLSAFQKKTPVNVVILGSASDKYDGESPEYRSLDSEKWYVHDYQMKKGSFHLVRSLSQQKVISGSITESQPDEFTDQFSIHDYPEKRVSTETAYVRCPEVRKLVLKRASGVCELCGEPGFKTAIGVVYLETHHVIPLAENGPDKVWNVVAICPNDHRRAHHAENREEIRKQLLSLLAKYYSNQTATISATNIINS